MIGQMKISATLLPRTGDRDDYIVTIEGPEPLTPTIRVSFSLTGSILSIWGVNSKIAVEDIARTIFGGGKGVIGSRGTASSIPEQGYWFDSYNSGDTLKETLNKIYNKGDYPFIKNRSASGLYGLLLGQESADIFEKIDKFFNEKFQIDFFKKLDEVFALSEIVDTLTEPPKDNANFLYKVCLLSCIIDAIHVRIQEEKGIYCERCKRTIVGSLEALKNWLAVKLGDQKAKELIEPLKMIKSIRNQFPIHNHYELKNGIRVAKKTVANANDYFGFTKEMSSQDKWNIVLVKFNLSLLNISSSVKV